MRFFGNKKNGSRCGCFNLKYSVSPGSDPFVVSSSLRDESRMRVSRNGGRDFF